MSLSFLNPLKPGFQVRSLRQEFRRSLLALFIILVLVYSVGLFFYFMAGLDTAKRLEMKNVALSYAAQMQQNDNLSPLTPITRTLLVAEKFEDLPKEYQSIFSKEDLVPGKLEAEPLEKGDGPPEFIYFVYVEPTKDGKRLYLADKLFIPKDELIHKTFGFWNLELIVFAGAGFSILVFLLVFHFLTRRVNERINALQSWADQLKARELVEERPDFNYRELNKIADHLAKSVMRIAGFVDREHAFLRHASHELRTPITIIFGNAELLEKIATSEQQKEINARIQRASHSMQTIVATLLWLGREKEVYTDLELIDPSKMIQQCVEDHRYLLGGKEISLSLELEDETQLLPAAPLEIILANMVRNAFQHSQSGVIKIVASQGEIKVMNEIAGNQPSDPFNKSTVFEQDKGIGLSLIRRMAERLNWQFALITTDNQVIAHLKLSSDKKNISINQKYG
ncbi:sensor histidine kinase [Cohaesibacter gelatinilyticus]|uniref:histidine kinase n=1 Tax=Cohaesibacter gelatinilyticus TaxID=372072 RepID=A0A285PII0_9HYPH|nr:HAMP domain-containing sensor histidine kinase [Cohaesibacter gelatinilyticus]SNZ19936.1 Signal transduction histidine kinase [Cohaesibacter gelatinilyticus]